MLKYEETPGNLILVDFFLTPTSSTSPGSPLGCTKIKVTTKNNT